MTDCTGLITESIFFAALVGAVLGMAIGLMIRGK